MNSSNIPIVITSYNRLNALKTLIEILQEKNETNIIILDNHSDYQPLLDYYETIKNNCEIIRLNTNLGHLAVWQTEILRDLRNNYYAVTDPDVHPIEACPDNFLTYFKETLSRFPQHDKIGFGLKIDDLPDNQYKNNIIGWETQYWENQIEPGLYLAPIDTTFALYKPGGPTGHCMNAIRTDFPYLARHESWYIDLDNIDIHDKYYYKNCTTSTHWSAAIRDSGKL